eukprot:365467-Chlamydomonas_euryale.AAC.17
MDRRWTCGAVMQGCVRIAEYHIRVQHAPPDLWRTLSAVDTDPRPSGGSTSPPHTPYTARAW